MSTELWAESPRHIGTPIVVETSTGDAKQMSDEIPEARSLSQRVRPGSEAAPWVCEEIKAIERVTADLRHKISNLLARAHRDGGHYEGEHGTDKACEDADKVIAEAYGKVDELTAKLADAERERDLMIARVNGEEESADCPFCARYPSTGHAQQVPMCPLCALESNRDFAIARAEEAEADVKGLDHGLIEMFKKCTRVESERDELRREAEALKADKARLDHLESGKPNVMCLCTWDGNPNWPDDDRPHNGIAWVVGDLNSPHPTLREAIDNDRKTK